MQPPAHHQHQLLHTMPVCPPGQCNRSALKSHCWYSSLIIARAMWNAIITQRNRILAARVEVSSRIAGHGGVAGNGGACISLNCKHHGRHAINLMMLLWVDACGLGNATVTNQAGLLAPAGGPSMRQLSQIRTNRKWAIS